MGGKEGGQEERMVRRRNTYVLSNCRVMRFVIQAHDGLVLEWVVFHTILLCVQEALLGKHIQAFFPPIQPSGMRTEDVAGGVIAKLEAGQEVSVEFTHLAADGTTFVCAVQGKVCRICSLKIMAKSKRMGSIVYLLNLCDLSDSNVRWVDGHNRFKQT